MEAHSTAADNKPMKHLRLKDGRVLAYAEYGLTEGRPAFYFHGTTSSRLEGALYDREAKASGVRLITVDRPGVGGSDPLPGRNLLTWPDDVVQLADHLNLDRYAVAGGSGGGPHALACAALTPERVAGVVLVNTAVPPIKRFWKNMPFPMRLMLFLFLYLRPLARILVRAMASSRDPGALRDEARYAKMSRFLSENDRRVMDDQTNRTLFANAVEEGLKLDPLAFATEANIFLGRGESSWGFDPFSISCPVIAFCGREDGSDHFCGELVAAIGRGSRLGLFDGGHISAIGPEASRLSMRALADLFQQ